MPLADASFLQPAENDRMATSKALVALNFGQIPPNLDRQKVEQQATTVRNRAKAESAVAVLLSSDLIRDTEVAALATNPCVPDVDGLKAIQSFRIRKKRFGGTVSGLREGDVTLQHLLKTIEKGASRMQRGGEEDVIKLVGFVAGCEKHKSPLFPHFNEHFHFVVEFNDRLDCQISAFKLKGLLSKQSLRIHVTNLDDDEHYSNFQAYCCKDGYFLAHPAPPQLKAMIRSRGKDCDEDDEERVTWQRALLNALDDLKTKAESEGVDVTLTAEEIVSRTLREDYPEAFVSWHNQAMDTVEREMPPKHHVPLFKLEDFLPPWNEPLDLFRDSPERRRCPILHGGKHLGKTELAESQGRRPVVIMGAAFEALKEKIIWSGPYATTHIVFDEFDGKFLAPEQIITLLTTWKQRELRVRYGCVKLPAIPIYFTTNKSCSWPWDHIFPCQSKDQQEAIESRIDPIAITAKVYRPASENQQLEASSENQSSALCEPLEVAPSAVGEPPEVAPSVLDGLAEQRGQQASNEVERRASGGELQPRALHQLVVEEGASEVEASASGQPVVEQREQQGSNEFAPRSLGEPLVEQHKRQAKRHKKKRKKQKIQQEESEEQQPKESNKVQPSGSGEPLVEQHKQQAERHKKKRKKDKIQQEESNEHHSKESNKVQPTGSGEPCVEKHEQQAERYRRKRKKDKNRHQASKEQQPKTSPLGQLVAQQLRQQLEYHTATWTRARTQEPLEEHSL